ncbi:hypothetical protein MTR67_042365 [Solanum verrucosum]|uniref:Uncharacterized protein n=1 Tax=Solanum verrucosum TaxID=315347 RepID=A0AAF0ZTL4_SOLVR|nr:hypothetical protein MTR67_042365 [Solanum verrucosum]
MALKVVVFVLFVAMVLFTNENNAETVGDFNKCLGDCLRHCYEVEKDPIFCPMPCPSHDRAQTQSRVCNVGCSLGHCYKFLINKYDHHKFGGCMTSCNENYCINDNINIALPKA